MNDEMICLYEIPLAYENAASLLQRTCRRRMWKLLKKSAYY